MKMNNKNNNSAVNAGPKGTLSKEMKEYDNFCEIMQNVKVWEKIPMIKLLEEEDDIRKAMEKRLDLLNLDPITFKPTDDIALHKLYNLLEEIGITRAELAAYDQPDFDCFYNPFDAEDYIEVCIETDFEEDEVKYIAECTPSIDILVIAREQNK